MAGLKRKNRLTVKKTQISEVFQIHKKLGSINGAGEGQGRREL